MDIQNPQQQISTQALANALYEISIELTESGNYENGALVFIAANRLKQFAKEEILNRDDGK